MSSPRRPGPRPSVPEIPPEEYALLLRLQRLRVLTSFQAHWLVDSFHAPNPDTQRPLTERNTRLRLRRLAEEGFLKSAPSHPEKGGFSGLYYRLGGKGLRALGLGENKELLRRPSAPVLRYLLLRNEVFARGRHAGWRVVSPLLFEPVDHPALLAELEPCLEFLSDPPRLTFDCLLGLAPEGGSVPSLVLLVVDDVRRAILPTARTPLTLAQAEELPALGPGGRLLLRDTDSRWDPSTSTLEASPRLRQWRRVLSRRYGPESLETDTLFPDLWSWRVRSSGAETRPLPDPEEDAGE